MKNFQVENYLNDKQNVNHVKAFEKKKIHGEAPHSRIKKKEMRVKKRQREQNQYINSQTRSSRLK